MQSCRTPEQPCLGHFVWSIRASHLLSLGHTVCPNLTCPTQGTSGTDPAWLSQTSPAQTRPAGHGGQRSRPRQRPGHPFVGICEHRDPAEPLRPLRPRSLSLTRRGPAWTGPAFPASARPGWGEGGARRAGWRLAGFFLPKVSQAQGPP